MEFINLKQANNEMIILLEKVESADLFNLVPKEIASACEQFDDNDSQLIKDYLRGIIAKKLPQESKKERLQTWFESGLIHRSDGTSVAVGRLLSISKSLLESINRREKKKDQKGKQTSKVDLDEKISTQMASFKSVLRKIYMEVSIR
jgi:hypothetical protein